MAGKRGAISPVIGVILMVAITVILAAVIAAFVFGIASKADGVVMIEEKIPVNLGYFLVKYHDADGFSADARVDTKYWQNITANQEYVVSFVGSFGGDWYLIPSRGVGMVCAPEIGPDYCYSEV